MHYEYNSNNRIKTKINQTHDECLQRTIDAILVLLNKADADELDLIFRFASHLID